MVSERDVVDIAWKSISIVDIRRGRVMIAGKARFDCLVFWAHLVMCRKFRIRARVFKDVFSVISHEATNEPTFSGAGRDYNKKNSSVDTKQVCDAVYCASNESATPR